MAASKKTGPPTTVSTTETAARAGVSLRRVQSAAAPGGELAPAVVRKIRNAFRFDPTHPAWKAFVGLRAAKRFSAVTRSGGEPDSIPPPPAPARSGVPYDAPPDVTHLHAMTLGEIVNRHGSSSEFADWLQARKVIADINRLELRNQRDARLLISRVLVQKHVFGYLDSLNKRLIQDAPRSIATMVRAAVKSGESDEECERRARAVISAQLRGARDSAARKLKACEVTKQGQLPEEDDQ